MHINKAEWGVAFEVKELIKKRLEKSSGEV
jgi:hypothetical protein